jgi:hypothetical protein
MDKLNASAIIAAIDVRTRTEIADTSTSNAIIDENKNRKFSSQSAMIIFIISQQASNR